MNNKKEKSTNLTLPKINTTNTTNTINNNSKSAQMILPLKSKKNAKFTNEHNLVEPKINNIELVDP